MSRELNPPLEIFRRIVFILYLASYTGVFVLGVMGLAKSYPPYLAAAAILGLAVFLIKRFGDRCLDFKRLAGSFPYGNRHEDIPLEIRVEAEQLFTDFNATGSSWQKRQELRKRLAQLVAEQPQLFEAYGRKITAVDPTLTAEKQRTKRHNK